MTPPLHEIVLAYKMDADRVMNSNNSVMGKLCAVYCLSLDYSELLKYTPEVKARDIEIWGVLFTRYMKSI